MADRTPYTALLRVTSATYDVPYDILEAQVLQESSGRADAFRYEPEFYERYIKTNPNAPGFRFGPLAACSYGLMQLMFETALEIGYTERPELLFVPRVGLAWGAKHLRGLLDWSRGDIEQALAAYNGGRGGNATRPFRNQHYVSQVLAHVAPASSQPSNA